jgi:hypothetical protein
LHGCETWLLSLRKEQALREFENRIQREMFARDRDEVTGRWKRNA